MHQMASHHKNSNQILKIGIEKNLGTRNSLVISFFDEILFRGDFLEKNVFVPKFLI